ncbi:MAG: methylmalonyl Co-A mutase-associated GTPase MeaB [Candidatus Latescibacterota bacterium]|nr:MAG: methylmalonyl Co-A mutase-associated GTPase MeaB [Candidatus Latescibacterota bacterium]
MTLSDRPEAPRAPGEGASPAIPGNHLHTDGRKLAEHLLGGDRIALARGISLVENEAEGSEELLDALYPRTGAAYRVGVTGPPGAGKSTLVGRLATAFWKSGKRVGVVAVDPSSPFTHGALLGDRIRFQDLPTDPRLFVRSMASRGSPGGLAYRTGEACDLLDAFGKEIVFIETVGVGQSELDIARAVHTTIVVLVPESGDEVQAMKAGLMEIGHIFVVNKADREGAARIARNLKEMLHLRLAGRDSWEMPVLAVSALRGDGLDDLVRAIERHRSHLEAAGALGRLKRERAEQRIREIVDEGMREKFWGRGEILPLLEEALARIEDGRSSPYREASLILERARSNGEKG